MAIPVVKLTILVGAGIVGTILTKEGRLGDVSSFLSGAFKIATKHLKEEKGSSSSSSKPATDYLLTQVNSLRQQLQNLQASGPVTIVTQSGAGSGTHRITAIFLVGVAGYGYAWWKGWKISDMMYVTKRRWSDARESVAKQVDQVSSSVSSARRDISSRIDRVNCSLEDCLEVTSATKVEVTELHSDISGFHVEVESVHRAVQSLGSKLVQIEGTQDFTTKGVYHLCQYVKKLESRKSDNPPVLRSNSVRLALEPPQLTQIDRSTSMPPAVSSASEPSSPSKIETPRVLQSSRTARVDSFKEVQGLTTRTASGASTSADSGSLIPEVATLPVNESKVTADGSSTSARLGWRFSVLNILTRTRDSADVS